MILPYVLKQVIGWIRGSINFKIFLFAIIEFCESSTISKQLGKVNECLCRRSSRQLAHIGGCHRGVQVVRMTANTQGKKMATQFLRKMVGATNEMGQHRLDLKKIGQKFVYAKSV